MALASAAAACPVAVAVPPMARKHHPSSPHAMRLGSPPQQQQQQQQHGASIATLHQRRTFICGLVAAGLGSAMRAGEANAAARRPPAPPPPTEKKDPNLSGVQAKVLASKRRKEAMEEAMAKLRERGRPVAEKPSSGTPK